MAAAENKIVRDSTSVVVITDDCQLSECFELQSSHILAMDCEGVDLGRNGELSIVQLGVASGKCFLFDVLGKRNDDSEMVRYLKLILEDETKIKIIHDCKMDADALFHILGIKLAGCHDTQSWDSVLNYGRKKNLNDTLQAYNCRICDNRDKGMYDRNYRFWVTRPMTDKMIDWASGDVSSLFALRSAQEERSSPSKAVECKKSSNDNENRLRHHEMIVTRISPSRIGRFIGKGGSNIQRLKGRDFHFCLRGPRDSGDPWVYAPAQKMAIARAKLAPYM